MKNIIQRTPSKEVQISEIGRHIGEQIQIHGSVYKIRRCGMPPHGGLGIGLERLTARLLGFDNVRMATLFPRDTHRLLP